MTNATHYLIPLANFTQAATLAANIVERYLVPEGGQPATEQPTAEELVKRMRSLFKDLVMPCLKGIDPTYTDQIRQIYGALVARLQGIYTMFALAQAAENPFLEPRRVGGDCALDVRRFLDEYMREAVRITNDQICG